MLANEILFTRKFNDNKPLFANQTILASQLVKLTNPKLKGPKFNREVARTKSLISGLLSPHQKRKIHPDFIEGLRELITQRTKDSKIATDLIQQIEKDLELLQIADDKKQIGSDAALKEMALAIRNSKHVILFLRLDPIVDDNDQDSMPIIEEILSSIDNSKREKKKIEFYFPSHSLTERFWISLYRELVHRKRITPDAKGIEDLITLNEEMITVYEADKSLFGINYCITDLNDRSSKFRKGFGFYLNNQKSCAIAEMDSDDMSSWGDNVKSQVTAFPKYGLISTSFESCLPQIFPGHPRPKSHAKTDKRSPVDVD